MKKLMKIFVIALMLSSLVWCGTVLADKQKLRNELIRLHVVANSDSQEDQNLKLLVRDAVVYCLENGMTEIETPEEAKVYIQENLDAIEQVARQVVLDAGQDAAVSVSLGEETFPIRHYDTFSLPSGVYESLRIEIGEGEGKNWWCVVFPSLCLPATDFEDTAAGAGFADSLAGALEGEEAYEIRFFFLDCLGKLENLFFGS